jgi:hypothetical protein
LRPKAIEEARRQEKTVDRHTSAEFQQTVTAERSSGIPSRCSAHAGMTSSSTADSTAKSAVGRSSARLAAQPATVFAIAASFRQPARLTGRRHSGRMMPPSQESMNSNPWRRIVHDGSHIQPSSLTSSVTENRRWP